MTPETRGMLGDITGTNGRSRGCSYHRYRRRPGSSTSSGRIGIPKKKEDDETRYQRASKVLEHFRSFQYSRSLDSIIEDDEVDREDEENNFHRFCTAFDGAIRGIHYSNDKDNNNNNDSNSGTIKRSKTFACLRNLDQDDNAEITTVHTSNFKFVRTIGDTPSSKVSFH
jgi:hypothetical protein